MSEPKFPPDVACTAGGVAHHLRRGLPEDGWTAHCDDCDEVVATLRPGTTDQWSMMPEKFVVLSGCQE